MCFVYNVVLEYVLLLCLVCTLFISFTRVACIIINTWINSTVLFDIEIFC